MDQQVKSLWVEALRSGEYQQGRNYLIDDRPSRNPNYCCLGVLCELYRRKVGGLWEYGREEVETYSFVAKDDGEGWDDTSTTYLPTLVMEWAELPLSDPSVEIEDGSLQYRIYTLSALNDAGKSFEFIANIIESQL